MTRRILWRWWITRLVLTGSTGSTGTIDAAEVLNIVLIYADEK